MRIYKKENAMREAVVSPETSRSMNVDTLLPDDPRFLAAVQNTSGAHVTDDGLEVEVHRRQKPEQSGSPSLRSGVFYLPSGSGNKNPYTGKSGYGGPEKIQGTTLLRRPLFVKGATGGRAPQMAYDLIKGKGAYQKVRGDILDQVVMKAYGWRSVSKYQTLVAIQEVLKKHGGDEELATQIVDVLDKLEGNNLAYAIQENIVAKTVRDAGYDSIVGWSAKRNGTPYLSEIFDVRETTYPTTTDPEGQIHHTFLQQADGKMDWYKQAMNEELKQQLVELIDKFVDAGGEINEKILPNGSKEIETGLGYSSRNIKPQYLPRDA